MDLHLNKLNYKFIQKPLLVGGKAMEYYGLRKSGDDVDLMASEKDVVNLIRIYPDRVKNLWGDLGVCPFEFEIWRTIRLFNYDYFKEGAIDHRNFLVISKEKLLFMKTLAMEKEKYLKDTRLIVRDILNQQNTVYEKENAHNEKILHGVNSISYIEKGSP